MQGPRGLQECMQLSIVQQAGFAQRGLAFYEQQRALNEQRQNLYGSFAQVMQADNLMG